MDIIKEGVSLILIHPLCLKYDMLSEISFYNSRKRKILITIPEGWILKSI